MRIVKVVLLLMALGAVAGAVTGSLLLLGIALFGSARLYVGGLNPYAYAALVGAGVGAVSGPLIALTLLRKVPIWRATVETAGAAGIGTALGNAVSGMPFSWAYGGLLFAILAALRLRRAYEKRPAESVANQKS